MKNFAIIVAGGSGQRMGGSVPKQFVPLAGKPVLMHAIEAFHGYDREMEIILVLPGKYFSYWEGLCQQHNFEVRHKLVAGGETRFHSVRNALDKMDEKGLVAIHDGVRPLVDGETIRRCFELAREKGNAVPVTLPVESMRKVDGQGSEPVVREDYRMVQTPQVFRIDDIKKAYGVEYSERYTDDAGVAEVSGIRIHLAEGNQENIKITNRRDLDLAESILETRRRKEKGAI